MKKKTYLALVIMVVVLLSLLFTMHPLLTLGISVCSLPGLFLLCLATTEDRIRARQERRIIKKGQ
jgi:Na+/H+ antiporter NhaD/arsenite permease-like protein